MQAFRPLERRRDFSGRSGPAEFWQWTAVCAGAWIVLAASINSLAFYLPFLSAFELPLAGTFVGLIAAVATRRFHDIGRSGLTLAYLAGSLAGLIFLAWASLYIDNHAGSGGTAIMAILAFLGAAGMLFYLCVQFARPGDVGSNSYGPPDVSGLLNVDVGQRAATQEPADLRSNSLADDIEVALERLTRMHNRGLLTDAEFADQKAVLLSRL